MYQKGLQLQDAMLRVTLAPFSASRKTLLIPINFKKYRLIGLQRSTNSFLLGIEAHPLPQVRFTPLDQLSRSQLSFYASLSLDSFCHQRNFVASKEGYSVLSGVVECRLKAFYKAQGPPYFCFAQKYELMLTLLTFNCLHLLLTLCCLSYDLISYLLQTWVRCF